MEFHLTRKQTERAGQWLIPPPVGETICYEEPLHHELLPQLMKTLQSTEWPHRFHGHFYRLRTNSQLIEEFVPASEHYKISLMAMSQKYHGAQLALNSVESIIRDLSESYLSKRTTVGERNQPKLVFSTELYRLRADYSSLLFLIRSMLDQFASLIQFLSGPTAKQFGSFADVMKKAKAGNPLAELPPKLRDYLNTNCEWFWKMRDVRDYIAHHGFVRLHLVEFQSAAIKFYIHDRLDLLEMAQEFMREFQSLLDIIDIYYSERILNA